MLIKKDYPFPINTKSLDSTFDYEMYSVDGLAIVDRFYGRKVEGCIHFSERDVGKCGHDDPAYKWDNGDVCVVLVKDGETCPAR